MKTCQDRHFDIFCAAEKCQLAVGEIRKRESAAGRKRIYSAEKEYWMNLDYFSINMYRKIYIFDNTTLHFIISDVFLKDYN